MWYGNKEFNQRGYPTPESIPDETACRNLSIPASTAWLGVVMGALQTLTDERAWQQFEGGISPAAAAARAQQIIDNAYALAETEQCALDAPAPYWDTAEDADDEQSVIEQVWYGIMQPGGDFTEQIADWILTGFIAAMFTPHAAIVYATNVPRFRLWFRRDGAGAIVRILVNGVLAREVDTYAPALDTTNVLIATDIATGGGGGGGAFSAMSAPYTITVEHTGTHNPLATPTSAGYGMTVIRSRLGTEPGAYRTRWYDNGQLGGVIQVTWDDGVTWITTPEFDPRRGTGFRFPLTGANNCQVAYNITQQIRAIVNIFLAVTATITIVNELVATVTVWIPGIGQVIDFVALGCAGIAALGAGAIAGAFTEATYHEIQCALDCSLDGGVLTDSGMATALARLNSSLPTAAYAVTYTLSLMFGSIGFTNAGTIDAGTAIPCDDCGCQWCVILDFTTSAQGFTNVIPGTYGTWASGTGWKATSTSIYVRRTGIVTASDTRIVRIELGGVTPTLAPGSNYIFSFIEGNSYIPYTNWSVDANPGYQASVTLTGKHGLSAIEMNPNGSNSIVVARMRFTGYGTPLTIGSLTTCP